MKYTKIIILFLIISLFVSCKNTTSKTNRVKIVASCFPLKILLENITYGTDCIIDILSIPEGMCPHDYQLTTGDMRLIEEANFIVAIGKGFEPFFDNFLQSNAVVVSSISSIKSPSDNLHRWLNIKDFATMTDTVTQALCSLDSSNKDTYLSNAKTYKKSLSELELKTKELLPNIKELNAVVFDSAFAVLLQGLGIEPIAVFNEEEGSFSSKIVNDTCKYIKELQEKNARIALFTVDKNLPPVASIIKQQTGANIYYLDTLLQGEDSLDYYQKAMLNNAMSIKQALQ